MGSEEGGIVGEMRMVVRRVIRGGAGAKVGTGIGGK